MSELAALAEFAMQDSERVGELKGKIKEFNFLASVLGKLETKYSPITDTQLIEYLNELQDELIAHKKELSEQKDKWIADQKKIMNAYEGVK